MTEKSGTVKNGNGLKISKTLAFEKRFDFYEQLWKEQVMTKKMTRKEYKEILNNLGPCACRTCGKESEKKTDIGYRKCCKKCTEKAIKAREAKKAAAKKGGNNMAYYATGEDRFIPKNLKLKVGPIRDPKHIEAIRKILKEEDCRMLAFFDLAINNGLRSCDLCSLKVEQVKGRPANSEIIIIE